MHRPRSMKTYSKMTVRRDDSLPKLGWYAVIDPQAGTCAVDAGRFVEVDPDSSPRWVYARDADVWHVSKSLVVLLGRLGARLHPEVDHRHWSESSCLGINNYVRQVVLEHPSLPLLVAAHVRGAAPHHAGLGVVSTPR